MNPYKLLSIVSMIRSKGPLPCDQWGTVLPSADLLVWFGLKQSLSMEEQAEIRHHLDQMAQAQQFMDQLNCVRL